MVTTKFVSPIKKKKSVFISMSSLQMLRLYARVSPSRTPKIQLSWSGCTPSRRSQVACCGICKLSFHHLVYSLFLLYIFSELIHRVLFLISITILINNNSSNAWVLGKYSIISYVFKVNDLLLIVYIQRFMYCISHYICSSLIKKRVIIYIIYADDSNN